MAYWSLNIRELKNLFNNGDGHENVTLDANSINSSNVGNFFEVKGLYLRRKLLSCFCPWQNVKLGAFRVVVVQQRLRSVQKSVVVFGGPIGFLSFSLLSLSSLLKLPIFKSILWATFQPRVSYINCCFFSLMWVFMVFQLPAWTDLNSFPSYCGSVFFS